MYQCFRGKDWRAYAQLQLDYQNVKSSGDHESLEQKEVMLADSQNEFFEDYTALQDAGRLPVLYCQLLKLSMPRNDDESVDYK